MRLELPGGLDPNRVSLPVTLNHQQDTLATQTEPQKKSKSKARIFLKDMKINIMNITNVHRFYSMDTRAHKSLT